MSANIFNSAIKAVKGGSKFHVDFKTRSLNINGKAIIDHGKYDGELGVTECQSLDMVEKYYQLYKHSIPSQRSEAKQRRYFIALPESELSNDDMLYGVHRDEAQVALELYLLCLILNGFQWDEAAMGKWFWQSKQDKDLIILRNWIDNN
jgi:hypothetical protein